MFYLFCIFVIFWVIHLRHGLTVGAIALAMLFGSVIAIFLGPCGAIAGTVLWVILASGPDDSDP